MNNEFILEKTITTVHKIQATPDPDSIMVMINLPKWDEDEYDEESYWNELVDETISYAYDISGDIDIRLFRNDKPVTTDEQDVDFIGFSISGEWDKIHGKYSNEFEINLCDIDLDKYNVFSGKEIAQMVWDAIYSQIENITKITLDELGNPPMNNHNFSSIIKALLESAKDEIFKVTKTQWEL